LCVHQNTPKNSDSITAYSSYPEITLNWSI